MKKKVMKKKKLVIAIVVLLLIGIIAGLYFKKFYLSKEERKFDVDNVLLKLTVKQGESISKTLKISNVGSERESFEVDKRGLDFISISNKEFSLEPGEVKTLEIDFDIKDKNAGVYLGEILISNDEVLIIPVILEIETKEILFDSNINVPPEYSKVYPGEKLVIENQIFNLENIGLKKVEVSYLITDFEGKTIFSEQENIAVESKLLNAKVIPIPKDVAIGNYVFTVTLKYSDSIGTSTYFFKVVDKTFEIEENLFMWIVIFLLFGLIFFIIYYVRQRDKMFLELQRQYSYGMRKEIKRQKIEKVKIIKLKPAKRKIELRIFRKKKKKRLRAIRKIHRVRVKVLKKLKKKKRKSQALGKLAQWKRQGYNVNEFLIKTEKKNLKGQAEKLKKQGYKV